MHGFHNLEYRCSFVAANSADLSLSSSWRENSLLQVFAVATVGLSLVGIGWLGYSLLAFLALIDIVAPLSAWAWSTFVR
jgi:hypothetical protein